ncbi:UDP-glucose 4-epimerase GalE [Ornithobacterium rhinotracheale]|uniref:UDP-glucose 4-epimerase n=1 Tax=Ornithobacterium rhinotracheale (strain ATCC 51463 / DSM 15997 / CCUG 23171 / CIP 104009 / LMG 9086) TaxID=867902 RepID=I4A1Q5_ORNRL|nr:UDP-glucose 4-epimerase GalE [Ornithobacterium rhinotracheale]AFL97889.1 UDP-glucose-4-epimerase [Ornithobacterium rhinotracheale DSM 15997]AIP99705.1 UDP-galactose-4-epimerase [Ornithobacterium rhinotracheale ORT-UMN 88]KGB65936.1 UDP-galactose-4-epimerase [Ornithobacterium rhinotracheale H06-030791]MBN3661565.1 UDP-glucose 4-epimerase GalE [Ornithobacterium rhinotracheale]MCK0193817.1 UDP-glucose 4-epimerase GalE [Ornithobacterium rhinotracheale]
MSKKVLVTGGLGYIGSHTVVELQNEGFEVVVIDDLSNSEEFVQERIEKITGKPVETHILDLKDQEAVDEFFSHQDIQGIIHFAAHKAVGESMEKPLMYYRNNILGLLNLLEAAKENNVDNFIFSSSCTVYGQADKLPIDETAPIKKAESSYGKTKQMGEEILEDFSRAFNKHVIALRYFNPIGAHPSALIGELPKGVPNNLIPFVTQTAAGIRECLSVFGDDYPTRDGTAVRDYIYVVDLAKAHVKALKRLVEHKNKENYEVFNLGTGTGSTVLEVIQAFEKANGVKLNYKITERRAGDITAAYADNSKASNELGWNPDTPLEEALRTAWEWQKSLK